MNQQESEALAQFCAEQYYAFDARAWQRRQAGAQSRVREPQLRIDRPLAHMDNFSSPKKLLALALAAIVVMLSACVIMSPVQNVGVALSGAEEVPPVATDARGSGTIMVADNMSVSGNVATSGLAGIAAHIHVGSRGENGPVAIGLVKTAENTWAVPSGAKFTPEQYAAFIAGRTYVNVHTPANKGGEIRAQLTP